ACLLASVASPSTSSSQTRPAPSVRTATAPLWRASITCLKSWPFHSVEQPCYTHRVAISNNRLVSMDGGQVSFQWKDYRDDNRQKTMTLPAEEFIRRFLIHVLPNGFHRIRYFGFLGNCHRA